MSTLAAEQVVAAAAEAARAEFGPEIEAFFTIGSLAHGGFAPLVSDVDVALILNATNPATKARIGAVHQRVLATAASPLAERLSIFWGDWAAVRTGESEHFRLGPIDRLDLLESGRLRFGRDEREPSVRPTHAQLVVMSADHILNRFTDAYLDRLRDPDALLAGGPRTVTKAILFPVRFMYTLRTGRIGLNEPAARWYADEGLVGGALAVKALEWRSDGIADPELARAMLEADLIALHAECFTDYATELEALGERHRAAAIAGRADGVRVPAPDAR